jgi:hypothetical protein
MNKGLKKEILILKSLKMTKKLNSQIFHLIN